MRAVLRRATRAEAPGDLLRLGDLTIDLPRLKVSRGGEAIDLTATEFQLLAVMARQPGRVFTRAQLLDAVRGNDGESFDRAIDAHVKNIRRKIEPDPRDPKYVETVYGIGYRVRRVMPPDDQLWAPRGRRYGWHRRRRFFLARVGGIFVFALVFGAIGLSRLIGTLAQQAGLVLPAPVIPLALLAASFAVVLLFLGGMRGVGMPLGDIVSAAERVGSGDYSARLVERGPPFLRSVARAFNTMASRLARQEQLRRDLMADVAHELRTPLSIMRGRLEGIVDGVYPRDAATLATLLDETTVLERLVEDLRTLAHAEGGTLKLQKETTDVAVLIADVVRSFAAQAQGAGVELRIEPAKELPLAEIDPVRVREVLANLLANALRYTPRGGHVSVSASPGETTITIAVTDTGAGIAAEELPRIFDRFAKGVDSRGSGLGLAIARKLVEAHGGTIAARSATGAGTTMTVVLPCGDPS